MSTTNPNDNLGVIQKKGDHLTVAIVLAVVLLVNCVGFVFPAYHKGYSNVLFDSVLIAVFIVFLWRCVVLWKTTFEEYDGSMILWLILSALANIGWILFWGAGVYTKQLNGF
jgi:hypothetical protein